MTDPSAYLITTPIYYVNDRPHIGHAYTTVLADVIARWQRLQGKDVLFATGTDEHGAKIARVAKAAKKTPQRFVDEQAEIFKQTWHALTINYDDFIRTTETRHIEAAELFLLQLKASGTLYQDTYEGLYCTGCEAFVKPGDLVKGRCALHKLEPEKVKEKNWFLKLAQFRDELVKRVTADQIAIVPAARQREFLNFLEAGLEDISISRENQPWGIPLPFDAAQTIYVWVDALINYLTVAGFPHNKEKLERYWPAALHIIGKDIVRFHCAIWPAMLLAVGLEPPKQILVHGYITIGGQKMSKTLGNVILPQDLIERFGPDGARYLLVRQMSPGEDVDITLAHLTDTYTAELKNGLGNLFSRTLTLAQRAKRLEFTAAAQPEAERLVTEAWRNYRAGFDQFNLSSALGSATALINWANRFVDTAKPWAIKEPAKLAAVIYPVLEVTRHMALQLLPFVPKTANLMLQHLGVKLPATFLPNQFAASQTWAAVPLKILPESVHLFS